MNQALTVVQSLILGLFHVIMTAMALIEGFLLGLMTQAGIGGEVQKIVLIVVLVLLIVAAIRLFGRIFGILIALFLALLLLRVLLPSAHVGPTH